MVPGLWRGDMGGGAERTPGKVFRTPADGFDGGFERSMPFKQTADRGDAGLDGSEGVAGDSMPSGEEDGASLGRAVGRSGGRSKASAGEERG